MARKRVAVVGSGCSGLGALWALKITNHDVHLFEADDCLGGHTNTFQFKHDGNEVNVDTGFIVYNTATFPNFTAFLEALDVATVPTEMTFGVSRDRGTFEWAGTSLRGVFAQRRNLLNPMMWRMIFDIVRFNHFALDLLYYEDKSEPVSTGSNRVSKACCKPRHRHHESIGDYLKREGYSDAFRDNYLVPMTATLWNTSLDKCLLDVPAVTLVRFMWNHHLLITVATRRHWRTIKGCSQAYIDAIMKDFPQDKVHLETPIVSLEDINGKVILQFEDETEDIFDHVIIATHVDTALDIISASGTDEERSILGGFQSSETTAYLHSDISLMPRRRTAWSACNYITQSSPTHKTTNKAYLTYNLNTIQHIPTSLYGHVLLTLNPTSPPSPSTVQGQWTDHHPLYTASAIASQRLMPRIQNTRGISYCGAWTKYGFHEDGFSSGVRVAMEHLGAEIPWEFVDDNMYGKGRRRSNVGATEWIVRWVIWYVGLIIWGVEIWCRVLLFPFRVVERRKKRRDKDD